MRHAIALLVAFAAAGAAGCAGDDSPVQLPVAPPSAITVAAPTGTITGTAVSTMIAGTVDCAPDRGIGMHAATGGGAVTVVFPRWPEEGALYDLSVPGTIDFVVVSARADNHVYCAAEEGASGTVVVNRFEQVGSRYLADVTLTGVVAGATTIDAHLYH